MSLPRSLRLRHTSGFRQVREQGVSKSGRLLTIAVLPLQAEPNQSKPTEESAAKRVQFGFTLSRKFGNAVHRNFTKRRLREICREAAPHILKSAYIVSIPRKTADGAEFAALRSEWRYLARKLGLLPPKVAPGVTPEPNGTPPPAV
jgi:ribonuclease P protein component